MQTKIPIFEEIDARLHAFMETLNETQLETFKSLYLTGATKERWLEKKVEQYHAQMRKAKKDNSGEGQHRQTWFDCIEDCQAFWFVV